MNRLPLLFLPALLLITGPTNILAQYSEPPSSLPSCGTFLYAGLEARQEHLSEKERELFNELKLYTRTTLHRNIPSKDGHFRIHFDTSGFNAPNGTDANHNGVPDYIDSVDYYMEYAWHKEIEECGYLAPPPDNPRAGVGGIDGRIDVYITNLGGGVYGFAYPDRAAQTGPSRYNGYIYLDNNYSADENYPTPGIDGLRITCAHEFHHVVQFASYREDLSQAALHEATSTWMEYKVHPDVEDYRLYVGIFLQSPETRAFSTHDVGDGITGYAHMQYLQSLVQQTDANIVKKIWEEFRENGKAFDAINNALLKSGSGLNLATSYCTFARWCYYTGTRAADTPFLAKAELYRTFDPVQTREMPDDGETGFTGSLMPLSFGLWRLTIPRSGGSAPDVIDFLITNARSDIGAGGRLWLDNPEAFRIDVSTFPQGDYLPIRYGTRELFYRLTAPHKDFCVEPIIDGSPGVIAVVDPTPQPFRNDGADRMVFAVDPGAGTAVRTIHLDIYSASMVRVATLDRTEPEMLENLQGIIWDGRDEHGRPAPSGVYIYTLSINGNEPTVGKFAVIGE